MKDFGGKGCLHGLRESPAYLLRNNGEIWSYQLSHVAKLSITSAHPDIAAS